MSSCVYHTRVDITLKGYIEVMMVAIDQNENRAEPVLRGRWMRRRYFVEGEFIKPIPTSEKTVYDPFEGYRAELTKSEQDPVDQLHTHLANLDAADLHAIEAFTGKWGILGLFQHDLYQVRYVPTAGGAVQPLHDPPYWAGLQVEEIWEGPDFRARHHYAHPLIPELLPRDVLSQAVAELGLEGEAVTGSSQGWDAIAEDVRCWAEAQWKNDPTKRGVVLTRGPLVGYREVPLLSYFGQFLPDLSGWPDMPNPLEAEAIGSPLLFPSIHAPVLWDYLCEPLDAFRSEVRAFQGLARLCAKWKDGEQGEAARSELQTTFTRHLGRSHPTLGWLDQSEQDVSAAKQIAPSNHAAWLASWSFPSLLSAAYLMLLFDFTDQFPRICKNTACRKLFVVSSPKRLHCSDRCLNQQKQRDHYARSKQKRLTGNP